MKTTTLTSAVLFFTPFFHLNAQDLLTEATFDETLTNETYWVYGGTHFASSHDNEMYINNSQAFIQSPTFDFAVTSISVTAKKSSAETSRDLKLIPLTIDGEALESIDITPSSVAYASTDITLPAEKQIQKFKITTTSGAGNIYLKSAIICGVPILDIPQDLQSSEVYRDRFTASWTPDTAATSHKIEVTKTVESPFTAQYAAKYDLSALENDSGSSKNITDKIGTLLDAFEGHSIYIPARTNGIIQIGSTENVGVLALPPQDSYKNLKLVIRAKYCDNDPAHEKMPVCYISGDDTNTITEVEFKNAFEIKVVDFKEFDVPDNARIALTSPDHNDKRFHIDLLGFATETKDAESSTEVIISTTVKSPRFIAKALEPNTEYSWSVTSYGEDGATSKRTQWQRITTNNLRAPDGFYIKIR